MRFCTTIATMEMLWTMPEDKATLRSDLSACIGVSWKGDADRITLFSISIESDHLHHPFKETSKR